MSEDSWQKTGFSEWKFHNEAAMNYAGQYIKALLILNGGAALALLAVVGQIYSKQGSLDSGLPPSLISSLIYFGYGGLTAVLTALFAYFTELFHADRANARHNKNINIKKIEIIGNAFHIIAVLTSISCVFFLSLG